VHCTFLDVDGLKAINDERGHDAGDRVILAVGQAIRPPAARATVVARWGGDEFVVVGLGRVKPPHHLEERVADYLAECHPSDEVLLGLHISVGRAGARAVGGRRHPDAALEGPTTTCTSAGALRPPAAVATVFLPDGAGPFEL